MSRIAFAAAGLMLLAATSVAPEGAAQQPARPPLFSYIGVNGYAGNLPEGGPVVIRVAEPAGDIADWFDPQDPVVQDFAANGTPSGYVALLIDVGPDGRATDCRVRGRATDPRLAAKICAGALPRVRAIPALTEDGARVADQFDVTLQFYLQQTKPDRPIRQQDLPPAPPMGESWPSSSDSQLVTASKLDLLKSGPASPQAFGEPWAGVVYQPERPNQPCRIVGSSGDAAFNERACAAAAKASYDFSRTTEAYQRRMPLHFVLDGGKPRALVPVRKRESFPQPTEAGLAIIAPAVRALPAEQATRLRLNVDVDASGAVVRCSIDASTGTDAGDVAACAAVRKAGAFLPAEDIFGRPRPARLYRWNPLAPPR